MSCNIQYIKAIIAILLKRIDISRLKVTEIDSNKDSIDIISIKRKESNKLLRVFDFFFVRDRQGLYTAITPGIIHRDYIGARLDIMRIMWTGHAQHNRLKKYTLCAEPEEKVEFSSLMYEIKVLPVKLLWLIYISISTNYYLLALFLNY